MKDFPQWEQNESKPWKFRELEPWEELVMIVGIGVVLAAIVIFLPV